MITGERICIPTGEKIPAYYGLKNQKNIYRFKTEISIRKPTYCNEIVPLSDKKKAQELIESCLWVDRLNLPRRKTGTKDEDQVCGFIMPEV